MIIPVAGALRKRESLELPVRDTAPAMLDISDKSLLRGNVETLNRGELYEISPIEGYERDSFTAEGAYYTHAPKYSADHILASLTHL